MANHRTIRVPAVYYQQALTLKKEIHRKKQINVPLWRCMIAVEESNNNEFDPFKGFKL